MLKIKLILASIMLFMFIYGIIYISNHLTIFPSHILRSELVLATIFFILSVFLIALTYKITEKKELSKAQCEFISDKNHELRTYITSISGALTIISNNLVGEVPVAMKDMVNIAKSNVTKLLELVNNCVEITKP